MTTNEMTNDQYRHALDQLGLSQGAAAEWLGISTRSSHGYANGDPIPQPIAMLLRLVTKLKMDPKKVK